MTTAPPQAWIVVSRTVSRRLAVPGVQLSYQERPSKDVTIRDGLPVTTRRVTVLDLSDESAGPGRA